MLTFWLISDNFSRRTRSASVAIPLQLEALKALNGLFNIGKGLALLLFLAALAGSLMLWFQTYLVGAYYVHSGLFLAIIVGAWPVIAIAISIWLTPKIYNLKLTDIVEE
jgi:hypothetical protein